MSQSSQIFTHEDEQLLAKTQSVRIKLVDALIKKEIVPGDGDEKRLLMQALDGIDKQVLAKTKIKSDDENQRTQAQTATIIADLLLNTNNQMANAPSDPSSKALSDSVILDVIVPGHMDVGNIDIDPLKILSED